MQFFFLIFLMLFVLVSANNAQAGDSIQTQATQERDKLGGSLESGGVRQQILIPFVGPCRDNVKEDSLKDLEKLVQDIQTLPRDCPLLLPICYKNVCLSLEQYFIKIIQEKQEQTDPNVPGIQVQSGLPE